MFKNIFMSYKGRYVPVSIQPSDFTPSRQWAFVTWHSTSQQAIEGIRTCTGTDYVHGELTKSSNIICYIWACKYIRLSWALWPSEGKINRSVKCYILSGGEQIPVTDCIASRLYIYYRHKSKPQTKRHTYVDCLVCGCVGACACVRART